MKRSVLILTMIAISCFAGLNLSAQNKLTVVVDGFEKQTGKLYIAVFDKPADFMKTSVAAKVVEINANETSIEFTDLQSGQYAATLFQDENSNGQLDLGAYGIPTEKYGFSQNFIPTTGVPTFGDCQFELKADTVIRIVMQ